MTNLVMKVSICCFSVLLIWSISAHSQSTAVISKNKVSGIYYHKRGTGKPAIVFVSGLGEDHNTWQTVQDSISKFTLTISYDRAGLGRSEYKGEKKDLGSLARELQQLIRTLEVPEPLILVGHSLGCQILKKYASLYPANVKSIIFLDPGYDERKLRVILPDTVWQKREQALKMYQPQFNAAQQAELNSLNKNCELADQITLLPKVPIIMFTATRINPAFPGSTAELRVKGETHRLWLESLPWAKQIEVKESRHYIQNDEPNLVINVIHKMIQGKAK